MKQVLHVCINPVGGLARYLVDVSSSKKKVGHSFLFNPKLCSEEFLRHIEDNQFTRHEFKIPKKICLQDFFFLFQIIWVMRSTSYNIAHGHGAKGCFYARVISIFLRMKCVYTPHGGVLHDIYKPLPNRIYITIEKMLRHATHFFVFESYYSLRQYQRKISKLQKSQYEVIYNGTIPRVKKSRRYLPEHRRLKIIAVGALRDIKGFHLLIRALKNVVSESHSFRLSLDIYGDGEERESLIKLINILGLQEVVTLKGIVEGVPDVMLNYDLLVHPALHESFGYVLIEAYSVGLPFITTNQGGCKDIVNELNQGVAVQANSVEALSKSIKNFMEVPYSFDGALPEVFQLRHMQQKLFSRYEKLV